MSLKPGVKLGPYEITGSLGAGGMGEVYRATDTNLKREVAIKVLPDDFANDRDRLARFEREAHLLASLNHPNIAAIYGLEESGGQRCLVLELVEGQTLAERIAAGVMPVDEALGVAQQIASALEAAHEKRIIHRDLKPDNVKIARDGTVKVLDFGLAKPLTEESPADASSQSPTITHAATRDGIILGTAAYMSPEQARGRPTDRHTDLWALGVVLWEMLTGRRLFRGETVSDTLAAVLRADPDWEQLPASTPRPLRRLLRRCLERDPRDRLHDAGDARLEIQDALSGGAEAPGPETALHRRPIPAWGVGAALFASVALAVALILAVRPTRTPPSGVHVVRFPVSLQDGTPDSLVRVSPDGRHISMSAVSEGKRQVWIRSLDDTSARALPGTEDVLSHFWSPDSHSIGFFADGKLKKLDLAGGLPETLCDAPGRGPAKLGTWGRDGTILFGVSEAPDHEEGLYRVSDSGGAPRQITPLDESGEEISLAWPYWPSFLPDGRHFLFLCSESGEDQGRGICVTTVDSPRRARRLLDVESYTVYAPPGYLLYIRSGVLLAHPFDLDGLRLHGQPLPVVKGVSHWAGLGSPDFSASENGVLVYNTGGSSKSRLVWMDRKGTELGQVGPADEYSFMRLAPDGRKVTVTIEDPQSGLTDVWIIEVDRNVTTRFTFGESEWMGGGLWSPDGRSIVYSKAVDNPPSLHRKLLSGGKEEELVPSRGTVQLATDWSPDGRVILYLDRDGVNGWDLWTLPLDGEPAPFVSTRFEEGIAVFSPDGRWVAYESNESGRSEVYVQPFEGSGEKRRVSTDGGSFPRWPRDGKELFYLSTDNHIMAVPATSGESLELGAPVSLFRLEPGTTEYDVTSDGQRFLVNTAMPGTTSEPMVVLNWTEELPD